MPENTALVAGSTGIVGLNLGEHLLHKGWTVFALARKPSTYRGIQPIAANLLDPTSLATALAESPRRTSFSPLGCARPRMPKTSP